MAQIVVALLLLAHGIGHVLFVANSWGVWKMGTARASLFQNVLQASQTIEGIFGLLWLIPLVGFGLTTWGYYHEHPWWRTTALASALVSVLLIVLWWGSLNTSSAFFALVFDVVVVGVLLWQQNTAVVSTA